MKIAVLSGKGGAGKTFISTNLARVGEKSYYLDCDIEEPNGHLFFKRDKIVSKKILKKIPVLVNSKCIKCKECIQNCNFNAISFINNNIYIFEEMCHSCGACVYLCKQNALKYKDMDIGKIEISKDNDTKIFSGFLNIKQASGGEIIQSLLLEVEGIKDVDIIIDAPPGVDCNVMDSIYDADYCIAVVEPTIFGLENFKMVKKLLDKFNKPFGVVINKSLHLDNMAYKYCKDNNIYIHKNLPFDKEASKKISDGKLLVDYSEKYKKIFLELLEDVKRRYENETTTNN